MEYDQRIRYAAVFSVLTHVCGLAFAAYEFSPSSPGPRASGEPIVISLSPPKPTEEKKIPRLISSGAATDEVVRDTDLISDRASAAQDRSDVEGDTAQPHLEESAEFDDLGTPPLLAAPAAAAEALEPAPVEESIEPAPAAPAAPMTVDELPVRVAEPAAADAGTAAPERESDDTEALPERFEMAEADPSPAPVTQDLRATRGREGGGAALDGFTSFEANQHALGGYMLELRKHVEREWRIALQLRYSGSSRAYAVLKCSISPQGVLERVEIVDAGASATYAAMCKRAVESAGRYFRPFPFEVPEIYRSKNLEIQWKFTYM